MVIIVFLCSQLDSWGTTRIINFPQFQRAHAGKKNLSAFPTPGALLSIIDTLCPKDAERSQNPEDK